MSLPFLAALAAAALTPRHSGAIAQRHGSLRREAPLHRGALVPEFDNDSTLLKNLCHSCFKEHSTGPDFVFYAVLLPPPHQFPTLVNRRFGAPESFIIGAKYDYPEKQNPTG